MPKFKEVVERDDLPARIAMDLDFITQRIIPSIPDFLKANQDIKEYYNNSAVVTPKIIALFDQYGMSTGDTDCFEETLCCLVRENLKKQNVFEFDKQINELVTTSSIFMPDFSDTKNTIIGLTTPIASAQHIIAYFNNLCPNSATMNLQPEFFPEKNAMLTKLVVRNTTLLDERFLSALKATIDSYPISTLNRYRNNASSSDSDMEIDEKQLTRHTR